MIHNPQKIKLMLVKKSIMRNFYQVINKNNQLISFIYQAATLLLHIIYTSKPCISSVHHLFLLTLCMYMSIIYIDVINWAWVDLPGDLRWYTFRKTEAVEVISFGHVLQISQPASPSSFVGA